MTFDQLKQDLKQQIDEATKTADTARTVLRQAEINLAFLQGQLHALNLIQISEPVYSNGVEEPAP